MVNNEKSILSMLDSWCIPYELHRHPPAHTIDDCLAMDFITPDVVICKNLFLCNRQKTSFYLMLIHPKKAFHTAFVSKAIGVSRLSFAPDELLPQMLGLAPGAVSPLGLCFDKQHCIQLVCDDSLVTYPRIAFHPCVNTSTVIFNKELFWQSVLEKLQVVPMLINVE